MSILEVPFVVLVAIVVIALFMSFFYVSKDGIDELDEEGQAFRVAGIYREHMGSNRCDLPTVEIELTDALTVVENATGRTFDFEDPDAWRVRFGRSDRSHGMVSVYKVDGEGNPLDVRTRIFESAPESSVDSTFHNVIADARDCP